MKIILVVIIAFLLAITLLSCRAEHEVPPAAKMRAIPRDQVVVIPEPRAGALFIVGAAICAVRLRRKDRR